MDALTELGMVLFVSLHELVHRVERCDEKGVIRFADMFRCCKSAVVEVFFDAA